MKQESSEVTSYSGRSYGERPTSFSWEGVRFTVKKIEREWREPGGVHFRLRTKDDRLFELCYDESNDRWSVREWVETGIKGGRDE